MEGKQVSATHCMQYTISITMQATATRVWRAITDQLSGWWLPPFHMLGEDSIVQLEPHAGGRLYEKRGFQELLWYTVLSIDPEKSMTLVGYLSPDFGGPATSILTLKLTEDSESDRTFLEVNDALYGHVTDGLVVSLKSGWVDLFSNGLKQFVERSG